MRTNVQNIKNNKSIMNESNVLYIGRANKWLGLPESKWHNPFPMKNEGQRKEVLRKFLDYILKKDDLLGALPELDDKTLVCYCYPEKKCHGNILVFLRLGMEESDILDWINKWPLTNSYFGSMALWN